ncbi:hypothetical protein [Thermococcus sp. 21S7]|uniref:hypothetical protein n=1 Tax=Thermococcus sp. 21S7 TaxID=1638221 RepID=UPI00143909CB|nr:hypothetical protein [Thermococcus sp. 21S7]NJE60295.1 hypothetical protein [Thermococcus sp. 21S7]
MRGFMSVMLVLIVIGIAVAGWFYSPEGSVISGNSREHNSGGDCVHPGYGELNAHVLNLTEENVSLHVGESAEITGAVEGKAFFVGNETCQYSGNATLRAYLGPEYTKDSWSYVSGKLRSVEGLKVRIDPSGIALEPGKTVPFTLKVTPERTGTYYLYAVAFSDAGWRSWAVVRINVS